MDISNEAEFFTTGYSLGFVFIEPVITGVDGMAEEAGVTVKLVDSFVKGGGLEFDAGIHISDVGYKGGLVFLEFGKVGFECCNSGVVELNCCGFIIFIIAP